MDLTNISNMSSITIDQNPLIFLSKFAIQTAGSAAIGAIIAIYSTNKAAEHNRKLEAQKNEYINEQKRKEAYGQLMGCKSIMSQTIASYFSELITAEYLNCRAKALAASRIDYDKYREMAPVSNINLEINREINFELEQTAEYKGGIEANRRSRDLQIKLGESSERLWATIGLILALFPNTPRLEETIKKIKISYDGFGKFGKDIVASSNKFKRDINQEAGNLTNESEFPWYKIKVSEADSVEDTHFNDLRTKLDDFNCEMEMLLDCLRGTF
jgi:hypothetical protein